MAGKNGEADALVGKYGERVRNGRLECGDLCVESVDERV